MIVGVRHDDLRRQNRAMVIAAVRRAGQPSRTEIAAATALADARRYDTPFGNAEALSLDEQGAWIGVDNNALARRDGEKRPVVWRFAAPRGGWSAR